MEALCSRLLNSPLDEPLRLQFQTFAPELQRAWHEAVGLLRTYEDLGIVLPASSASSLEEFVGTLILKSTSTITAMRCWVPGNRRRRGS